MEEYEDLFIGYCDVCKKEVKGEAVEENGVFFHVNCFVCQYSDNPGATCCGKTLQSAHYFLVNSKRTCPQCYEEKIAATCHKCLEKIIGSKKIEIDGGRKIFHIDCFGCIDCEGSKYSDVNVEEFVNLPEIPADAYICKSCYYVRYPQRQCYYCEEFIEGNAVLDADGHPYHLNCFTCDRCERNLDTDEKKKSDPDLGNYVDFSGNVYCPSCYHGFLAPKCGSCLAVIGTNTKQLMYKDEIYCDGCFACHKCGMKLSEQEFFESADLAKGSADEEKQTQLRVECATQDLKGQCLTFCE